MDWENYDSPESVIGLLSRSKAINSPRTLWIVGILFLAVGAICGYIVYLQIVQKVSENYDAAAWLLGILLSALGILFAITFVANEREKQFSAIEFIKEFYENFSNKESIEKFFPHFTAARNTSRYSTYKSLLHFEGKTPNDKVTIGIDIDDKCFYIYSQNQKILDTIDEKWKTTRPFPTNLWLKKDFPKTYEAQLEQLTEYADLVRSALK